MARSRLDRFFSVFSSSIPLLLRMYCPTLLPLPLWVCPVTAHVCRLIWFLSPSPTPPDQKYWICVSYGEGHPQRRPHHTPLERRTRITKRAASEGNEREAEKEREVSEKIVER